MICKKCGNEMPDDMNFCMRCGSPLEKSANNIQPAGMPVVQSAYPTAEQPKKANSKTLIIIIAAVVAVVIAVVGLVVGIGIGKDRSNNPDDEPGYVDDAGTTDDDDDEPTENEEGSTQHTEPEIVYLEATNEDFEFMCTLASELIYFTGEYDCTEDYANAVAVSGVTDLFSSVYYICMEEYNFQEPDMVWNEEGTIDPEGRFPGEYDGHMKYKASTVDWIVRNVFSVEPVMTECFSDEVYTEGTSEYCLWYRKGDYYYSHLFAGGRESSYIASITGKERMDDGRYKIRVNVIENSFDEEYPVGNYEIIAGLKEVDGKRVWSFEKWNEV